MTEIGIIKREGKYPTKYIYMEERIKELMKAEEAKAWKSLAGYKFYMFGYHAAAWVKLNQLLPEPLPNPFRNLVRLALPYKNQRVKVKE